MPVNQFFLMLEKSFNHQGMTLSHQCDIAWIPAASPSHYEDLKSRYNVMAGLTERETKPEFKEVLKTNSLSANVSKGKDARFNLKKMASIVKGSLH